MTLNEAGSGGGISNLGEATMKLNRVQVDDNRTLHEDASGSTGILNEGTLLINE